MIIKKFEDIKAWQKAQDLTVTFYDIFSSLKDYGFKDQLLRAAISISNNIAEGFDRSSDPEFVRFLYYALGSCSEVKSMIYLSKRLKYIPYEKSESLLNAISEVSRIIVGLINSIKNK